MAELVDARDLKSLGGPPPCRFKSGPRHHPIEGGWGIRPPPPVYNKNNDWDVAVFFSEPPEKLSLWPAFEIEAELSRGVGETVQVIVLNTELSPVFGFEILKHGILLLDRDEDLRIDFENRILRQYYDWQYFLKRQIEAERDSTNI